MKLLLVAASLVALAFPALADPPAILAIAAAPSDTTVAIGNALTFVATMCTPPVAAILAAALWKLADKWGFQASAQDKANLESDLQTALALGVSKTLPEIRAKGWDDVNVHSQIVAEAANYFLQRFPNRASAIGSSAGAVGPGTQAEAGAATLMARLPEAITIAAASPATPPAAAPAV